MTALATAGPTRVRCSCGALVLLAPRRDGRGSVILEIAEELPRIRCKCTPRFRPRALCAQCQGTGWQPGQLPRTDYFLLGPGGLARVGTEGRAQRLPAHSAHVRHQCLGAGG